VGDLDLLVLDSADADDAVADPMKVRRYASQIRTLLRSAKPHSWLLSHRPFWALAQGVGVSSGMILNETLQAAAQDQDLTPIEMVMSGYVRDFMVMEFEPQRPRQMLIGSGGASNDPITQPLAPGIVIDGKRLKRGFAMTDYGFTVLDRSEDGWTATYRSIDGTTLAKCDLSEHEAACRGTVR
jgi:hypothetical protein